VTLRGYDGLDRLRTITYNDGSTITYTYDDRDRITQIADTASGTIGRGYDDLDRLTTETTLQGTVSYTYDAADRRATMTVAGQPDVVYSYDDADRLTGLTRDTLGVTLAYDEANRRTSLTLPNGIVTEYGYDAANQLTSLTYLNGQTTLGDLTYTYDLAGQRVAVGGSWARTLLPQPVASASYDAANELTVWGGQSMASDPNGNLTFDGTLVYGWNARNQLASLAGGTTAGFTYDATGRRTAKTIDGTTTTFLYDGVDAVQTDAGGSVNVRLLGTAIDEWFASVGPGGVEVPLVDALGSSLALADGAGAPQTSYTYGAFGATSASGAASDNAFQFTGRENDRTGLNYHRARYAHSGIGRFVSQDPAGLAGGINLYAFAGDTPVNVTDRLGLEPDCDHRPCNEQLKDILNVAAEISRRYQEYASPKWLLPLAGRNSRSGHIDQIDQKQRNLRKRIDNYNRSNCPEPIPIAVQDLATRPLPQLSPSPVGLRVPPDAQQMTETGAALTTILVILGSLVAVF
jgi:RHS repeat-associated protein